MSSEGSRNGRSRNVIPLVLVWAAWLTLSACFVLFAAYVWPAGGQDAQFLLPPAVEYHASGELVHPFWPWAKEVDPAGVGRLVYHGFLLQLMAGSLAPAPGYPGIHRVLMGIAILGLACFTVAVTSVLSRFKRVSPWYRSLVGVLAVAGLATVLLGLYSRPEPLVMLFVSAAFIAMLWTDLRWHWIAGAVAVGLIGVTSPGAAALALLLLSLYLHARQRQRPALIATAGAIGLAAVIVALVARFWYPYSIAEWGEGLRRHSVTLCSPPTKWIHYWIAHPRSSFYGILFLLAIGLVSNSAVSGGWRIKSRVGFAVSLAVLALFAMKACFYVPRLNYNLLVFSPLAYLAVMFLTMDALQSARHGVRHRLLPLGLGLLVPVVFLLTTLGFARTAILFPEYLKSGSTYYEAKARFEEILRNEEGSILITPTLFGLIDDYARITVLSMPDDPIPKTFNVVILGQVGLAIQEPPGLDGYTLVEDRFTHEPPRVLGFKIANSCHGYDFAVYRREET